MKTRRLLAQMAWIMEIIMREDLSNLPEEPCACCSWTILTPKNVGSHRNPSCIDPPATCPLPPVIERTHEAGFRRPRVQRVKINSADV